MSETVKIWLTDLFEKEIKDAEVNISNNELWVKGSNTREEELGFLQNIEDIKEYRTVLEQMLAEVNNDGTN